MRVPRPISVSFSTSDPRPTTTSSAIRTRSRTHAWSPTMQPAPIVLPAKTTAPVEITVPAPISVGGSGSRLAVDFGPSVGCLPTTACSSTRTPSTVPSWTTAVGWTSAATEALRQPLERAHDHRPVPRHLLAVALACDQTEEVLALEPERLVGRDLGDEDVAAARLPLAVGLGALPRRLVVDRHLALQLHVVEDRHLVAADHGHPPHLVRVEPGEVHMRDLPGREAEVAEDDVLDAGGEEVAPVRERNLGLLVEQVEDHRQVVHPERPEGVLVR